jgi:broad specificity phosphatase PhoE
VSTLTLVRHGQAQTFQREAAVLSSLGEEQAAALARWWLKDRVCFDDVYTGALVRQTQTELVVANCFREAGEPWPEALRDPAWNEYDARGGELSRMAPADPRLAALAAEFDQARGGPDEKRRFQRMFEAAMSCWLEGSIAVEGVEPWPAFRDRVSGAIAQLMAGFAGRRVVVFTSGGPIGYAVQFAMKAPPRSFLEVNWRVRNTSVTEFVFDRDRFTLDSFNSIAHLDDPAMRTYR